MTKKITLFVSIFLLTIFSAIAIHKNRVAKDDAAFLAKSTREQFKILQEKYGAHHPEGESVSNSNEPQDVDFLRREINILLDKEKIDEAEVRFNDLINLLNHLGIEASWPSVKNYKDLLTHAKGSGDDKKARSKNKGKKAEEEHDDE